MKDELHEEILTWSNAGEALFEEGKYSAAIEKYLGGLVKVPRPQSDYQATMWLLTAIGDCYFMMDQFEDSLNHFKQASRCEGGHNPFIMMRIGQCMLEMNATEQAEDYLMMAYEAEGASIFEEDNPKYLAAIQKAIAYKAENKEE